jgi:hypothetical protein
MPIDITIAYFRRCIVEVEGELVVDIFSRFQQAFFGLGSSG